LRRARWRARHLQAETRGAREPCTRECAVGRQARARSWQAADLSVIASTPSACASDRLKRDTSADLAAAPSAAARIVCTQAAHTHTHGWYTGGHACQNKHTHTHMRRRRQCKHGPTAVARSASPCN
jgi:hypothetical protein